MRRGSHRQLGKFLADKCMENASKYCVTAFKFGCIEPDMNPATYLKGSRRAERLRGHNFRNAEFYMKKVSDRLEKRGVNGVFSFYRLGKLVHYITDAFTYAHNENFGGSLREHSAYEVGLHRYFPEYLKKWGESICARQEYNDAFGIIEHEHSIYMREPSGMTKDSRFAIETALSVVAQLLGATPALSGAF